MTRKTKVAFESAIVGGVLYFEDVKQCSMTDDTFVDMLEDKHLKAIRVQSLSVNWQLRDYVAGNRIEGQLNLEMTLRKEYRSGRGYWYAYRRVGGLLLKRFVGQSDDVTEDKLIQVAQKFPNDILKAKATAL